MLLFESSDSLDHFILRTVHQRFESLLQFPFFAFVDARPDLGEIEHGRDFWSSPLQPFHNSQVIRRRLGETPPNLDPMISTIGQELCRLERTIFDGIKLKVPFALLAEGFPFRAGEALFAPVRIAQP